MLRRLVVVWLGSGDGKYDRARVVLRERYNVKQAGTASPEPVVATIKCRFRTTTRGC